MIKGMRDTNLLIYIVMRKIGNLKSELEIIH